MLVKEIMCKTPAFCTPDATLVEVARLMTEHDCGAIPVCDDRAIVGIVTDRDLVCRAMALHPEASTMRAAEVMTAQVATVNDNDSIQRAVAVMSSQRVRRIPVVKDGALVGMLSQADLAEHLPLAEIGALVRKVSTSAKRLAVMV